MRRRLTAAMVALAFIVGACGDDDDPVTTGEDATTTTAGGGQTAGDVKKYCDTILKIETFPEPEIDFESLSQAQQAEEAKKFSKQLLPLAEEARAAAPAEVKTDVNLLADTVVKITQTGDFSAFETPEVEAASDRTHAYELANCGWERVDVTAVEYSFQGIPPTVPAGAVSFELANKGKEPHEIRIARIKDDVKMSAAELLKLPEDEGRSKVENIGGTFAEPGKSDSAVTDLKPGRYLAACFVPVGGGEEGPPHASKGMFAEFEVK